MAAALEYICAEVLDLSGAVCSKSGYKRLTARHIRLAIDADDELNRWFHEKTISEGGVTPYINPIVAEPPKVLILKSRIE